MPPSRHVMLGATRGRAVMLGLAIGLLARAAIAGEVPVIGLAQEDADGQPALPRLSASDGPEPLITFELAVSPSCPAGTTAPELVVSIADTTRVITAVGQRQPLAVQVPLGQLQWLADPAQNCATIDGKRAPDVIGESGLRLFRLHAVTAAFATLVCAAGDGRSTAASSALPLDAWLACPVADEAR